MLVTDEVRTSDYKESERFCFTISEKDGATSVPSSKDLFFQHDLGNPVLWCPVYYIAHGQVAVFASRDPEMADLVSHGLGSLRTPVRTAGGIGRLGGRAAQMLDNDPTDRIAKSSNCRPLTQGCKKKNCM